MSVQIISAVDQCGYIIYPWKLFITNLSIPDTERWIDILFEDSVSGQIIGNLNQWFANAELTGG